MLRANDGRLKVFRGIDDLLYPSFAMGADGAIFAILTVLPDLCVMLWRAVNDGDHRTATDTIREQTAAALAAAGVHRHVPA